MNTQKSVIVAALSLVVGVGTIQSATAQNKPWNQQKQQPQASSNLPETTKLEQNDNLDPTVNRTQAMRAEAETGSIAPITGQPLIQDKNKPQPKATKPIGKRAVTRIY